MAREKEAESESDREQTLLLEQTICSSASPREENVLEYIIHSMQDGMYLEEALQEDYVRRNASSAEIQSTLENLCLSRLLASSCANSSPLESLTRVRCAVPTRPARLPATGLSRRW